MSPITIFSNGKQIIGYQLWEVDIQMEVNRVPYALLTFIDGDYTSGEFKLSNSNDFIPGKELEIKLAETDKITTPPTLFKGIVVKHAIEGDAHDSRLIVELRDLGFKMTTTRKNNVFPRQQEQEIFKQIISSHNLEIGTIDDIGVEHQELVQYYCSDWDFLLSRADVYGYWVWLKEGKVSIIDPIQIDTSKPAKHKFELGLNQTIYNIQFEINAAHQIKEVESLAWNLEENAEVTTKQTNNDGGGPGNLKSSDLAEVVGAATTQIQSIVPIQIDEQQKWVQGKINRSRFAMNRGQITISGDPLIELTETIEITRVSDRFNGKAIVTGVRHRISEEGWFTDVQFGLRPESYVRQFKVEAEEAGGLLPGIGGVQLGIVESLEDDAEGYHRIRVLIPAIGSILARFASPYAGDQRGILFRPEVGDEVVVGFLNDDPRNAIILGSLYNSKAFLPIEEGKSDEENFKKGIFSRAGIQIKFDDEKKVLEVLTSKDQHLKLDEEEEKIEIQDKHGNQIIMDKDGIHFVSTDTINMEAKGKITIKGSKVDIQ